VWLDNLKELKAEKQMSAKQIAEKANLPDKTVCRILSGHTMNPYIDTLDRIATALGASIGDIVAGTNTVVGNTNLSTLQDTLDSVTAEKETIIAERDLIFAENTILKDKVSALTAENEMLKIQLMHKDEIIALHNYYNKLKPANKKGDT